MRRATVLLLLVLAAPACAAQSAIHHCVSADGSPVFTDQPCDSIASLKLGAITPDTRHACPATRGDLRRRVAAAFGERDANALAGLMLWDGYVDNDAVREVARLQQAMQRPFLGVVDATGPPSPASATVIAPASASSSPAADHGALVVHLGGVRPDPGAFLRFAIKARAGCLWLRP